RVGDVAAEIGNPSNKDPMEVFFKESWPLMLYDEHLFDGLRVGGAAAVV
ncbi:28277_t:CDS:2, partial [Gigaspora margarita]